MMEMNAFISRLFDAAKAAGIAPAEASYTGKESFSVRVREGKIEDYQVSSRTALTLRGVFGGRIGTASTQALDEESVELLIRGVAESAELIEDDDQDEILPPDDHYDTVCNYSAALSAVTAEEKIALAMEIDRLMHASGDERLKPDDSLVATSKETMGIRNTLGLDLAHTSNMIYAYASALGREGEHTATGYKLLWGHDLSDVAAKAIAEGCEQDVLSKLNAGRMKSGEVTVVIKNSAMADLLTTFSGVFSADNAQKGLSLLAGREGETIASPCVTLTDDPLLAWGLGSTPFDCEGAATRKKNIIEKGTLKTLLHNRSTAKKAGVETTGNSRGSGRVAPTNLFLVPGSLTCEEMLSNMGDGLYLTEVSGLHAGANPISGDFSLLSRGFEVKDGKIVRAVEQFTVAGNFYKLLGDIVSVGSDLTFEGSPVGCPSVRVKSLNVAGE
ncbi:MAG: metallopeptidase TldD-related protein [Clostridia bacterium]|nr:metallopeptidase TldD-related protein [Clostridia bacterium]